MNHTPGSDGVIAFEGLDATGKTRLSRDLSSATGWPVIRTPDPLYEPLAQRLRHDGTVASFLLFLSGCAYAWREHQASGRDFTIIDRFWLSSIVGYASSAKLSTREVERLIDWTVNLLPIPAATILLVSSREARLQRLASRESTLPHEHCTDVEAYWIKAARALQERDYVTVVVDTSSGDEAAALTEILKGIPASVPLVH